MIQSSSAQMSASSLKVTVIIPTRERSSVLEKALATVIAQDHDNLEILVSDNASVDHTREVVLDAGDARVKYLNTGRRISMTANWEFALSHVTDGWVTLLGDDDGLLPGALAKVAELARSTQRKAIRSIRCSYSWPSRTGEAYGRLRVPLGHGHEIRASSVWLDKLMNGRARYLDLPMLYEGGFVDMSVLHEIKRHSGRVYHSCIPDVFSAIAIASVVPDYVFSHEPLAISGVSSHSTGSSLLTGADQKSNSPVGVFRSEGNMPLHADIPPYAGDGFPLSEHALVYECFLQSAFLRSAPEQAIAEANHRDQLEIILASAGKHHAAVNEWGEVFAHRHGLPFEELRAAAKGRKLRRRLGALPTWLRDNLQRDVLGSSGLPLKDVHEASIAVAAIRGTQESRITQVQRVAERLVKRRRS